MTDILTRIQGHAGRITLNRPDALNAMTWDMCLAVEAALEAWADNPAVKLVVIDGAGDKAFCAGGDVHDIYKAAKAGDYDYADRFWRDEYRMVAKLFNFPKPVVTFLHSFTLGGGVGVGCHGSHRIVCENSVVGLPEAAIGLVPDVGGSLLLARAPGRLGEYLALTGDKMSAADAIHAGFADYFIAQDAWPALIDRLCDTGDWTHVDAAATPPPPSCLAHRQGDIDGVFGGETIGDIWRGMPDPLPDTLAFAQKLLGNTSPLVQRAALLMIRKVRTIDTIEAALMYEFRCTSRALEHGDFLEGIRAMMIDKDRAPKWRYATWEDVPGAEIIRLSYPVKPPLDLTGAPS